MNEQSEVIKNTQEEKSFEKESILKNSENKKEAIQTIIVMAALILLIVGGFLSGCVRCTNCGNDDNRFFIYASGTSEEGVDYQSCVGPAGCLGFGVNSKCWPTECLHVKGVTSERNVSGCVTYYNEVGCIANSGVKSVGKYDDQVSCFGINCVGTKYVETVAETTKAREQFTCLGMKCGNETADNSRNYNSTMPRQFEKGCWSNK